MEKSQYDKTKHKLQTEPFEIDQDIKEIELKPIEKKRLDIVYDALTQLEQEPSSDEDSLTKRYIKEVEEKANQKKMNEKMYKRENKKKQKKKKTKKFEDVELDEAEEKKPPEIKIGKKALRKMLRLYISPKSYGPEDIDQMIWEVDEDMDGRVSKYEMEKMYKRCIVDEQELEPKKLFYFIMFLMFDKENKRCINEEDTLELLRVRHRSDEEFNAAIKEIFNPEDENKKKNNSNNNIKEELKKSENNNYSNYHTNSETQKTITFEEYVSTMTTLVLKKRDLVRDKRENYCKHIKDEQKNNFK